MNSRHQIDLSLQFDRTATPPESRLIEVPDQHPVPARAPKKQKISREVYRASAQLQEVVNLAIALGRPLLLQGDPGCGKTRLAHAVAYALGLPLEEATIKSTTKAQDLLYSYDAVRRLYDSQLQATGKDKAAKARSADVANYIRFGPLGRAIIRAGHRRRSVVLIDEIDKADLDFPNDLLRELDRLEFEVPETPGVLHRAPSDLRPIVFITHNEEKALPNAFLRRCVFHYVEFPQDELDTILTQHQIKDAVLRAKAIDVVQRLRKRELLKKPGLSELLDWAGYLQAVKADVSTLEELPALQALVKNLSDVKPALEEFPKARSRAGRA
jgi:MoxR-like ATPase